MKKRTINLLCAMVALAAVIAFVGCPTPTRPDPPIDWPVGLTWAAPDNSPGITGFMDAGSPNFSRGTVGSDFFGIRMGNLSTDWWGLDIVLFGDNGVPGSLAGPGSVTVTGFGDETAAGLVRIVNPDDGHATFHSVSLIDRTAFTLTTNIGAGFADRVRLNSTANGANIIITEITVVHSGGTWRMTENL